MTITPIKSADRVLEILAYVAQFQPVSPSQIRKELEIPKSSLHGLLETLSMRGFLDQTPDGEFRIGLGAFEVGSAWHANVDLTHSAAASLRALVRSMNQTGHVGVLSGRDIIYTLKEESDQPIRLVSAVGKRLPAHATALGKVLLGALTDDEIHALLGDPLPVLTDSTIRECRALIKVVHEAQKRGYAVDRGESTLGVTCFAAPILDMHNRIAAAISLSTIDNDHNQRSEAAYIQGVIETAAEISAKLGAGASSP